MGRLIDADKFEAFVIRTNGDEEFVNGVQYVLEKIDDAPTVEAIPKAYYETRLKDDKVTMLTELQLEIEGLEVPLLYLAEDYEGGVLDCKKIIQKKIKSLKGE